MAEDTIDELSRLIDHLHAERDRAETRLQQIGDEISAVEQTIDIYRRRGSKLPAEPLPNVNAGEFRGLSQLDALILIANKHGGRFKVSPARKLMVEAGLFKNPDNASGAIHTVIQRSDRFERVKKGTYRLIARVDRRATMPVESESSSRTDGQESLPPIDWMPETNQPIHRQRVAG